MSPDRCSSASGFRPRLVVDVLTAPLSISEATRVTARAVMQQLPWLQLLYIRRTRPLRRPSARASGGQGSGVVVGRHRRATAGLKGGAGAVRCANATTATSRAWFQVSGRSVEFSYAASNHHLKCLAVGSVAIELGMSHTHPSVMSRGLHQETGIPS